MEVFHDNPINRSQQTKMDAANFDGSSYWMMALNFWLVLLGGILHLVIINIWEMMVVVGLRERAWL